MRDVLGPGTILGYCTNVHAGATLAETKANLERYAVAVKQQVSPAELMGVGLWFSAATARELLGDPDGPERLRDWLEERGLLVYTLNGFPHGDFHQKVVKYDVYVPDWSTADRARYTLDLINILHRLLPDGAEGSISTLPLGWRTANLSGWEANVECVVNALQDLHVQTDRVIHLDLEPEPGCRITDDLTMAEDVLWLFHLHEEDRETYARHLRVCLDVCHGGVMFERPTQLLERARNIDIRIGKVQLSSALRACYEGRSVSERNAVRSELERFVEPRYLHQTTIGPGARPGPKATFDDLPQALAARQQNEDEWRVHFHVPLYMRRIGRLDTTQQDVIDLLTAIRPEDGIHHFEVETYAWNVLPPKLRTDDLAEGIARELLWVKALARELGK
jgi:hypothetical protein